MKYIKHINHNHGLHTWDFSFYYNDIVPNILKSRKDLAKLLESDLNGIINRDKTFNNGIIEYIFYNLSEDKISLKFKQRQTNELISLNYSQIINFKINADVLPLTIMAHEIDLLSDNIISHCLYLLGGKEIIIDCEKIEMH